MVQYAICTIPHPRTSQGKPPEKKHANESTAALLILMISKLHHICSSEGASSHGKLVLPDVIVNVGDNDGECLICHCFAGDQTLYSSSSSSPPCSLTRQHVAFSASYMMMQGKVLETYIVCGLFTLIALLVRLGFGLVWGALLVVQRLPALAQNLADLTCDVQTR